MSGLGLFFLLSNFLKLFLFDGMLTNFLWSSSLAAECVKVCGVGWYIHEYPPGGKSSLKCSSLY